MSSSSSTKKPSFEIVPAQNFASPENFQISNSEADYSPLRHFLEQDVVQILAKISVMEAKIASQDMVISGLHKTVSQLNSHVQLLAQRNEELDKTNIHDSLAEKVAVMEKEIQEKVTTWASVVKNGTSSSTPLPSVDSYFVEHEKRTAKALNVRVRGFPNMGQPLQEAKDLLAKLEVSVEGLDTAWRCKWDDKILMLKFKNMEERLQALRRKKTLKGTQIYLDDDLTASQYAARREIVQEARLRGQRVVFTNGRPRYFTRA